MKCLRPFKTSYSVTEAQEHADWTGETVKVAPRPLPKITKKVVKSFGKR